MTTRLPYVSTGHGQDDTSFTGVDGFRTLLPPNPTISDQRPAAPDGRLLPIETLALDLPAVVKFGNNMHNFNNPACAVPIFVICVFGVIVAFMLHPDREFSRTNDLLSLSIGLITLASILDMVQYGATHNQLGRIIVPLSIVSAILTAIGRLFMTLWISWVAEGDRGKTANVETDTATNTSGYNSFQQYSSPFYFGIMPARAENGTEPTLDEPFKHPRPVSFRYSGAHTRYLTAQSSLRSKAARKAFRASSQFRKSKRQVKSKLGGRFRLRWTCMCVLAWNLVTALTEANWRILILFQHTEEAARIMLRVAAALNVVLLCFLSFVAVSRIRSGQALISIGAEDNLRYESFMDMSPGVGRYERRAQRALIVLVAGNTIGIVRSVLSQVFMGFTEAPLGRVLFAFRMGCYLFTAFRTAEITAEICSRSKQMRLRSLGLLGLQGGDVQPGILQDVFITATESTNASPSVPDRTRLRDARSTERRLSTILSIDDRLSIKSARISISDASSPAVPSPGLSSPKTGFWSLLSREPRSPSSRRRHSDARTPRTWNSLRSAGPMPQTADLQMGRARTRSTPAEVTITETHSAEAYSCKSHDSRSSRDTKFADQHHEDANDKPHSQRQRSGGSAPLPHAEPEVFLEHAGGQDDASIRIAAQSHSTSTSMSSQVKHSPLDRMSHGIFSDKDYVSQASFVEELQYAPSCPSIDPPARPSSEHTLDI
ncbi:hypothetical protein A4X13_0g3480 [Tilletia indica]|uniref:Uncharacterized protein n=1 Tax=Tilletia indica TaxID=43049 RepID=A0A8T8T1S8_9BASI|nr:hypothetical protein A4X13_0g3480 [Tilletia indica]